MNPTLYALKVPFRSVYLHAANRIARESYRSSSLLARYGIDVIFDVGANQGQYGRSVIRSGFPGRMVSFEPLPEAFEKLQLNRTGFPQWKAVPIALGSQNTTAPLHIAGNSQSSSLLPMSDRHVQASPGSATVGNIDVPVKRLDHIIDDYCSRDDRVFLKVDVQGLEHEVIKGASGCLDRIVGIQLELSMQSLYKNSPLWDESIALMRSLGFTPASITPGFADRQTGIMLQADGLFIHESAIAQVATNQSQTIPGSASAPVLAEEGLQA